MSTFLPALLLAAVAAGPLSLTDPAGDDRGPGSYVPPSDARFRAGDFDLRSVSLTVEGDAVVIAVTFGASVRRDVVEVRQGSADLDLPGDLFVQNVDLYLDLRPGGHTEALPGRRVAFRPEAAWDLAVVLSPQPQRLRPFLRRTVPELELDVRVPDHLRAAGATLTARLPLTAFPEPPGPHWGIQVVVTGARWEQGFEAVDRIRGQREPNAYVLPVLGVAEDEAFGGGGLGRWHPWAVDILAPAGTSQAAILSAWHEGQYARLPMIYPDPEAHARAVAAAPAPEPRAASPGSAPPPPPPTGPWGRVTDLEDDQVVLVLEGGPVNAYEMGTVQNDAGGTLARVVVLHATDTFAVAKVVEGRAQIRVGSRVLFKRTEPEER